jgi:RluA family pseudouridine synthase
MKIIEKIVLEDLQNKSRLSEVGFQRFEFIHSRKALVKAIKRGDVLINEERGYTSDYVNNRDIITVIEQQDVAYKPYKKKLVIIFEDDYLAVINKPAGIDVSGNKFRTIENMALSNIKLNKGTDGLKKLRPVHRLDNPTSGLLLIAKTSESLIELSHQFQAREISKSYNAIVVGHLPAEGEIRTPSNNQEAITLYKTLSYYPSLKVGENSLVELKLLTGRTHQLRIHLSQLGYPILGDKLYGNQDLILSGKGLFLAAIELSFKHPITHDLMFFKLPLPHKFQAHLEREVRRYKKYNS